MKDKLLIGTLGLLPKNLLSRAMGAVAALPLPGPIGGASVRGFARAYKIDVDEAEYPIEHYKTISEFFIRRLRPGARAIDRRPGHAVSPADGRLANSGRIESGRLIQAKGRHYTVAELFQDDDAAAKYANGAWATVYLSPQNYHRVHHPVEGEVVSARYIPGYLWPVNRAAVENIDRLFCVNERLVTFVDSPIGEVATVMVGATNVGRITVSYDSELETNRSCKAGKRTYDPPTRVARGDELGIFHLGSTAIVLFSDPEVRILDLTPGAPIRLGTALAKRG